MTDRKISTETHEAGSQRPVKIIQIIQDIQPSCHLGCLFGLGDDGVVYFTPTDTNRWRVYVPLEFCEEGNNEA